MENKVIALDIGGTNLRAAIVKKNKIFNLLKLKTPKLERIFLNEIWLLIEKLINNEIKEIGISIPGPVKNGVVLNPPNIPLNNFNLKKYINKRFRVRVEVENDAKCVALAEFYLGLKKRNFFVLTLGTGIGGGAIIDGKLFNRNDIGAEFGYVFIEKNKTLEELVGMKFFSEKIKKELGSFYSFDELIRMKTKNAKKLVDDFCTNLGRGIGSLINVFNPEIIILAGGVSKSGEEFIKKVNEETEKYVLLPKKYKIVATKLYEPGILGASLLFK
ncbi:MAG: ROK family protein [Candidatus Pacearchaeota archaeon]